MDIRKVKKLIDLLEASNINEIEIREGDQGVRIQRLSPGTSVHTTAPAPTASQPAPPATETAPAPATEEPADTTVVKAPMVGTYYSASAPGEKPFVTEGQQVAKGDTLCIIEAMKTMNQLKAPVDGTVSKIHASNGDPIEYNQVLINIRTS